MRSVKKYRLSVCKGADCKDNGSDKVFVQANAAVKAAGIGARCEVFRGGCYGLCHLGPNVVVREDSGKPVDPFASDDFQLTLEPGETYYWKMTPEKMIQVIQEHVVADRPVDALRGDPTLEDDFRKRD